jgi:hypothetical protein
MEGRSTILLEERHRTLLRVSYRPLVVCDHVIAPLVLFSIRSRELPEERPAQEQWLKEECGQGRWRSGMVNQRKQLTRRIAKLCASIDASVLILSPW